MLTLYGTRLCPQCVEALEELNRREMEYDYLDIFASTKNLKALLALRDHREEFAQARQEGLIGIPCFLRDDGSVTLSLQDILEGSFEHGI